MSEPLTDARLDEIRRFLAKTWRDLDAVPPGELCVDLLREVDRLRAENESLRPRRSSEADERLNAWMRCSSGRRVTTCRDLCGCYSVQLASEAEGTVFQSVRLEDRNRLTRADVDRCINAVLDRWEEKYGKDDAAV